ncbi:MAG: transketolase [Bdellovibrionales bacterium]|nr:transketolase [Bdellovibrionales bacterium]
MNSSDLKALAKDLRVSIIDMITEAKSGHPGGSLSAIDVLTALWFSEMKGVPSGSPDQERDHFVLSKGHAVPALYAILAKKGYIPEKELKTLRQTGSRLQGHPDRVRLPIVEASTGSLGQGLSVAQGMAMGYKMSGSKSRVYCMVGDGEIQEGQIWEAALSAPKFGLSNLCVILDNNGGQIDGPTDEVLSLKPIAEKWRAFNWEVLEINGHEFDQILGAFKKARELEAQGSKKPVFIIANTVKGKGVSFMENKIEWHGAAPKADDAKRAVEEVRRG